MPHSKVSNHHNHRTASSVEASLATHKERSLQHRQQDQACLVHSQPRTQLLQLVVCLGTITTAAAAAATNLNHHLPLCLASSSSSSSSQHLHLCLDNSLKLSNKQHRIPPSSVAVCSVRAQTRLQIPTHRYSAPQQQMARIQTALHNPIQCKHHYLVPHDTP